MNIKTCCIAAALAGLTSSVSQSADLLSGTTGPITSTGPITNTTTLQASTVLAPGRYNASIVPSFNTDMGKRLTDAFSKYPGVSNAKVESREATIHFTIKNGSSVHISDLQKVVAATYGGAVMSEPYLDHSMSTNPGL